MLLHKLYMTRATPPHPGAEAKEEAKRKEEKKDSTRGNDVTNT